MKKVNIIKSKGYTRERTLEELEHNTYTIRHANVVRDNFCNNTCLGKNCNACHNCDIEQAHNKAVEDIKNGERIRPVADYFGYNDDGKGNYGAKRVHDGKGHKTLVWRAF